MDQGYHGPKKIAETKRIKNKLISASHDEIRNSSIITQLKAELKVVENELQKSVKAMISKMKVKNP